MNEVTYANISGFVYRDWAVDFTKKTFAFGTEGTKTGFFEVFWLHCLFALFLSLCAAGIVTIANMIGVIGLLIGFGVVPLVFVAAFILTWIKPFKYWYNMMVQQLEAVFHKNYRCEIYKINSKLLRIKHKNIKFHYHLFGDFKTKCLKMRTRKVELNGKKHREYWCTEILFSGIPRDGKLVISYV
jgi:hypothetical protein